MAATSSPSTPISHTQPLVEYPTRLNGRQWWQVVKTALKEVTAGSTSLVAAGCAFYATLALFPTISVLISIYGLAFDVQSVEPQLNSVRNLLPPAAFTLIADRIQTLVTEPHSALTMNLIVSFAIAFWSASAGTKSILFALNVAYEATEDRSYLKFQATALIMTFGAVIGACLALATQVALPIMLDFLPNFLNVAPPPGSVEVLARLAGAAIMLLFLMAATTMLYRFGPCRPLVPWIWAVPGAITATLIWIITSLGFSYYVAHVAGYNATYGPLGAVVAVMMWFFVSAWVVLLGAELNASLEIFSHALKAEPPQA